MLTPTATPTSTVVPTPTVNMSSPGQDAVFKAPATIQVDATVTSSSGNITDVEFSASPPRHAAGVKWLEWHLLAEWESGDDYS